MPVSMSFGDADTCPGQRWVSLLPRAEVLGILVSRERGRSLSREVFGIAWPMIISELGDSLYSIADTYFVSRLGTAALAAVGLGSYLSWLFFVAVALFATGSMVFVAQSYGAKAVDRAREALGETIVLGALTILCVALGAYTIAEPLILLVGGRTERAFVELAASYFRVRILGLPILATALIMDSAVRAVGATRLSMVAVLSSAMLNIVLDPILIFGLLGAPAMGVAGAALATVLSIAYMIPVELLFLKKLGLLPIVKLRTLYVRRVIEVGGPAALERLVFALGNNAYIAFISRCGESALAAHQIGLRIESFIYMPGFAFSIAASALVGQRIGAGDIDGGKRVGFEAAKLAVIIMAVLGVALAIAAPIVVKPFATSEEVAKLASIYLILAGLSEPGLALAMTISGAIRGGGNTVVPLIINAVGLYLFRVIPAALLTKILGAVGAWLAMFVDVYLRGAIFLIVYIKKFERITRRVV